MNRSQQLLERVQSINESSDRLGRCFELAYQALTSTHMDWTLVHGIARLTAGHQKGRKFGHAWLEKDDLCYDPVKDIEISKDLYYRIGQVSYTAKYSFQEAMEMAVEYEHYGPWDQEVWDVG